MAAFKGHVVIVTALIDGGANVSAQTDLGETPLKTIREKNQSTIKVLLQAVAEDRYIFSS